MPQPDCPSTAMENSLRSQPTAGRQALNSLKLNRLNQLLADILPANRFYADRFAGQSTALSSLEELAGLPFTTKADLVDGFGPAGMANQTWPTDRYVRFHQTSGSHGRPLPVWDTAADWQWWLDCWRYIYDRAGLQPGDGVFVAASFGPYIGFWSGFDAAIAAGGRAIPSGGLATIARLELLRATAPAILLATPSYALRLAEVAAETGLDTAGSSIRCVVVAGEPGGSVPAVRQRIATAWGADVLDHAGATEIGPWGVGSVRGPGLEVIEDWFHPEFLTLGEGKPAAAGELAELVITTLGRAGCPVIRYRTGDVVRPGWPTTEELAAGASPWVQLEGGVLGRADDMLVVRGVNVFPSAIDNIVRSFPEVAEYRLTVSRQGSLDSLALAVEDQLNVPGRLARELQVRLGLRVEVEVVPPGSLPRFEGKGRRVVDERNGGGL